MGSIVEHPIWIRLLHVPEYTVVSILVVRPLTFNKLTVWLLLAATKEYQTSSSQPFNPLQVGVGVVADWVAPAVLPAVVTPQSWFAFTVREIAPTHSSFAGGGGGVPMHKLKFTSCAIVAVVVKIQLLSYQYFQIDSQILYRLVLHLKLDFAKKVSKLPCHYLTLGHFCQYQICLII